MTMAHPVYRHNPADNILMRGIKYELAHLIEEAAVDGTDVALSPELVEQVLARKYVPRVVARFSKKQKLELLDYARRTKGYVDERGPMPVHRLGENPQPVYHPSELRENPLHDLSNMAMVFSGPEQEVLGFSLALSHAGVRSKTVGQPRGYTEGGGPFGKELWVSRADVEQAYDVINGIKYKEEFGKERPTGPTGETWEQYHDRLAKNPKGGGYSGISGLSLKEAKSLGTRYAQLDQRSGRPQDAEKAWRLSSSSDFVSYFMPVWDLHRKKQEFVGTYDAGYGGTRNPYGGSWPHPGGNLDLESAAFDAGKWWKTSGAYAESGVSNAKVAGYGFHKWYNDLDPRELKDAGTTKRKLEGAWMEGWAAGERVERKGNPEESAVERETEEQAASSRFADFHGVPSTEILEIEESVHYRENLAVLGELTELTVELPKNREVVLDFEGCNVFLACNPDGTQLFFTGGDQELDIAKLGFKGHMADKESILIGPVRGIVYFARKQFDDMTPTNYEHKLGEESGELPSLVYSPLDKSMTLTGGAYRTTERGLEN